VAVLSRAEERITRPLVSHCPSEGKSSGGSCLCSSLRIVGFFVGLVFVSLCALLRTSLSLVGLAPSMYLSLAAFSSVECWPVTTPLWSLIL